MTRRLGFAAVALAGVGVLLVGLVLAGCGGVGGAVEVDTGDTALEGAV
jgi:hypothetical protein